MMTRKKGVVRIYYAVRYSLQGLRCAWQNEAALRQEVLLFLAAVLLVSWLDLLAVERILLLGSLLLVIVVELINSAIEAVVDRIGSDYHPLSGQAKDLGSAAVFISLLLAAAIWITLLWRPFFALFN
ncbi:MAG: diacylglycerol kinase [Enterobacteriaceae bacterium]